MIARISAIAVGITMTSTPTAHNNIYDLNTVVIGTDLLTDTVYALDTTGNIWSFYGVEDWDVGDGCRLQMYDNRTPQIIEDDVILRTTYTG
jgi:hypothetical protein